MNRRGEVVLFLIFGIAVLMFAGVAAFYEQEHPSPPPMDMKSMVDRALKEAMQNSTNHTATP